MTIQNKKIAALEEKCLVCNSIGTAKAPIRRGLCGKHYAQFRRAQDALPLEKRGEFEENCIQQKMLLPNRQGKRKMENPFEDMALKMMPSETQAIIKQAEKAAEKHHAKTKKEESKPQEK